MRFLERRCYQGPNLYAHFRVIRFLLDLGPLEEWPSAKIPGFTDGLIEALPGLQEHGCSYSERGGFIRRLTEDDGTWMGHVLEHVALEIQSRAGFPVTFGKTRGAGPVGHYHVVYEYEDDWIGEEAGYLALKLLHSLIPDELHPDEPNDPTFDFASELRELTLDAQERALGPSTGSLVKAAEERDIPWMRIGEGSLVQFGHGHLQRRIWATITSETKHIAVELASDKSLAHTLLRDAGLPVPKQDTVRSVEGAIEAWQWIGGPCVTKPLDGNHGRGVGIALDSEEAVRAGFLAAQAISRTVVVESYQPGYDHRLLVVAGRLVAASRRMPGHVVGDGEHTVAELVAIVNSDPRRGVGHEKVLTRIVLDDQAQRHLDAENLTAESVLPEGKLLFLRSTANLSTGGTATDVTDTIHPDNREMAERAARVIGLDVGGVDFLTPDITRSYHEIGGAICEVNAAPGFRMHVAPSEGQPRDPAGAVMDMLFPLGTDVRIPIAAITGTNGKTTTSRMLAHIHKMSGKTVGLASTDGVYVNGRRTVAGDMTGPTSARMVLRDPNVEVAVLETARGGLLRAGMAYRRPNVSCCINVAADHLGLGGIETVDDLARVKRIPIEVATDAVFLNADDQRCLAMAEHARAERVAWVTMNPQHELVREHVRAGGLAVGLEAGVNGHMITIYDNHRHQPLLWTHLIPATLEGKALHNVQNAMFAAGMAYAMKVRIDDIQQGLRTFDTSFFQAPGRLNVFDELGFRVVLDYGHNAHAITAMCELVDRLSAGIIGQRTTVLSIPGDRRDADILEMAARAAQSFDRFICREDDNPRGRAPGEIPELLARGLREAGVADDRIHCINSEVEAIDFALTTSEPGDLVMIFADEITRCWKQIIYHGHTPSAADPVPSTPLPPAPPVVLPPGRIVVDERGARLVGND